jgi:hypothetical protein
LIAGVLHVFSGGANFGADSIAVDPKLVAAARELRDRWLEKVNGVAWSSCGSPT